MSTRRAGIVSSRIDVVGDRLFNNTYTGDKNHLEAHGSWNIRLNAAEDASESVVLGCSAAVQTLGKRARIEAATRPNDGLEITAGSGEQKLFECFRNASSKTELKLRNPSGTTPYVHVSLQTETAKFEDLDLECRDITTSGDVECESLQVNQNAAITGTINGYVLGTACAKSLGTVDADQQGLVTGDQVSDALELKQDTSKKVADKDAFDTGSGGSSFATNSTRYPSTKCMAELLAGKHPNTNVDTTVQNNATNLVTSKAVYDHAQTTATSVASTYAPKADPTFTGTVIGVTKTHVGLGNCDNTSDMDKPVGTAMTTALQLRAPKANPIFTGNVQGVTKTHVGLGQCNNRSDADKPVSTATQTALDLKAPKADPSFTGELTAPSIITDQIESNSLKIVRTTDAANDYFNIEVGPTNTAYITMGHASPWLNWGAINFINVAKCRCLEVRIGGSDLTGVCSGDSDIANGNKKVVTGDFVYDQMSNSSSAFMTLAKAVCGAIAGNIAQNFSANISQFRQIKQGSSPNTGNQGSDFIKLTGGCGCDMTTPNGEDGFRIFYNSTANCKVKVNGTTVFGSDDRIKTHEQPIANGLSVISKLDAITYYKMPFNEDPAYQAPSVLGLEFHSGFIAQQVRTIPELAHTVEGEEYREVLDPQGNATGEMEPNILHLNYTEIIPFLVKAVQELQLQVSSLEQQLLSNNG